ncbi:hypothetical protein OEZ85_003410 [Tetradesmus obliquus]|uniref:Uncharacterized protein n=1 Tax=Tetradesmus obliquus TaxID=3088 RepID=A0ABY8UBT1_TETOB|nr:hypothetical protein OEZ85_003410 [Tetradesmus obliquus]
MRPLQLSPAQKTKGLALPGDTMFKLTLIIHTGAANTQPSPLQGGRLSAAVEQQVEAAVTAQTLPQS